MQYDHEGVEITISVSTVQSLRIDSGIDQWNLLHRSSCRLGSADDWTQPHAKQLDIRQIAAVILATAISYAIWAWRSQDRHTNTWISNIVNWYRNRSAKTSSSYILSFGHGRRLNSTVSNHAKQWEMRQNSARIVAMAISYTIRTRYSRYAYQ